MALDKQKILNELGSVMNQLQSADCGCMGKLFNNTNSYAPNMNNPTPGSGDNRHGYSHCHGYNQFRSTCTEEPCSTMASRHMNYPCMGRCNPPKLYSDTYQYLNTNLMQPVVQDVYNDLKTITPDNTIMNNQLGNALLPSQGQTNMQQMQSKYGTNSENVMNPINNHGGPTGAVENAMGNYVNGAGAQMGGHMGRMGGDMNGVGGYMSGMGGQMSEMGSNIVNMMLGERKTNVNNKPVEGKSLTQPMLIDAPQSPHGQVGVVPIPTYNTHQADDAQLHAYNQYHQSNQGNLGNQAYQMQVPNPNKPQIPNVGTNQMTSKPNAYGQHTLGVNKFNEMFPGVMQNTGGDLGFDPMAIAVQMNPANHKQVAFDTMQKIMNGNNAGINKTSNLGNSEQPRNVNTSPIDNSMHANVTPIQRSYLPTDQLNTTSHSHHGINQQINQNQKQENYPYSREIEPQQVYTALTSVPENNQQPLQQYQGRDQEFMQQQSSYLANDPNINANNTLKNLAPNSEEVMNHQRARMQPQMLRSQFHPEPVAKTFEMEKDPIFPANISQNQSYSHIKRPTNYTYNTLGQPIEMLSAKSYHKRDPGGPQTLSPQDFHVNSKPDSRTNKSVRATVSKTSIMGNNPIGRSPSKSQLQHIYNKYKGSQSLTQQNVYGNNEGASYSDGKLNVAQQRTGRVQPDNQVVVEKLGGDTLPNNYVNDDAMKRTEQINGQIGDASDANKRPNNVQEHSVRAQRKARNGLQDVVYTSYPTSTAWSFHGNTRPAFTVGSYTRTRF